MLAFQIPFFFYNIADLARYRAINLLMALAFNENQGRSSSSLLAIVLDPNEQRAAAPMTIKTYEIEFILEQRKTLENHELIAAKKRLQNIINMTLDNVIFLDVERMRIRALNKGICDANLCTYTMRKHFIRLLPFFPLRRSKEKNEENL